MLPLRPSSGSTLTPIPTHQHHTKAMLSQLVLKCAARSGWAAQAQQHPNQLLVSALLSPSLQPCAAAAAASSFNHTYTSSAAPAAAAAAPDASAAEHTTNSAAPSSIEVSMHGSTALLELNRPKQMNALSTQVMHEVVDTVMALDADRGVRAIILTGRGKAFAAGADIREMATLTHAQVDEQQLFARWQQISTGRRYWTPLIAAVNGVALGGGAELAMLCDIIIASSAASFGLPEVTLGVIPGIGGTQRLSRLVGRARAVDAMLTASRLSADEALSAGLVSRVLPPEQLIPEAMKIADKLASLPAGAVAKVLQAGLAAETLPLEKGLQYERELFYSCFGTHDQREGMAAFLEKRKPAFAQGKDAVLE